MNIENKIIFNTKFEEDVYAGLTAFPKYLLSKYFYDKAGDKLFQDIMAMPEYYLTDSEFEIFKNHKNAIALSFDHKKEGFDLIELGAGDGKKTKVLLKHFDENSYPFTYIPIDISQNAIDGLTTSLKKELPNIDVQGEEGEYFEVLERLKSFDKRKKVIMVLGSNIGNLMHPRAIQFLKNIQAAMHENDLLFMGFDQKKNPQVVLDAYNDKTGITAAFNKNVLHRINREMGANFDVDSFMHWETYDPESGTAKSHLISTKKQQVIIDYLDLEINFEAWESIHTEISQKYDHDTIKWLGEESGLEIVADFTDSKEYYKNYLFKKKP